jgi:hypothetical protein
MIVCVVFIVLYLLSPRSRRRKGSRSNGGYLRHAFSFERSFIGLKESFDATLSFGAAAAAFPLYKYPSSPAQASVLFNPQPILHYTRIVLLSIECPVASVSRRPRLRRTNRDT